MSDQTIEGGINGFYFFFGELILASVVRKAIRVPRFHKAPSRRFQRLQATPRMDAERLIVVGVTGHGRVNIRADE